MLARPLASFSPGEWMSFRELRLRLGKKIQRRCGHLCGRCARWMGEWVKYGYGVENHESQSPHFSEKQAEAGCPEFVSDASVWPVWHLRRSVCAGDTHGCAR